MPKFRKKPVVVEAVQLTPDTLNEVFKFTDAGSLKDGKPAIVANPVTGEAGLIIPTPEGPLKAREGDWVIKGVKGELYPCSPDIFEQTYTPVGDDHEDAEVVVKCERCEKDVPIKSVICHECAEKCVDGLLGGES